MIKPISGALNKHGCRKDGRRKPKERERETEEKLKTRQNMCSESHSTIFLCIPSRATILTRLE